MLSAGVTEGWDKVWLFPPRVTDMWGCVGWERYFPQDNGVREALQLQPPYTLTLSSWCLRFGLVIPPSHCDILVSKPMASCHSSANKCPWFLPVPSPPCTQLFNPWRVPFLDAALPIFKLHVAAGMRRLFPISKFPNFLLPWGMSVPSQAAGSKENFRWSSFALHSHSSLFLQHGEIPLLNSGIRIK